MSQNGDFNHEPCLNCGDVTPGRYCRACGQRKGEVRVSMRRLIADVLEDQLSLNAALPRTLYALFLKPGKLTAEYTRGRVAAYIAPFRLYLVASLAFFLTASIASRIGIEDSISVNNRPLADAVADTLAAGDETAGDTVAATNPSEQSGRRPIGIVITEEDLRNDSIDWNRAINTGIPALDAMIIARAESMRGMNPGQAVREIVTNTLEYAPTAMFILLPVFALLLKFLYIRSKRYYVEHFVFALHLHAFAFLLYTVIIVIPEVLRPGLLLIWLFVYLPIALKRVYGQGWFKTLVKWTVLSSTYSVILAIGVTATAVIAFLAG